jgi:hypothetical protein
MLEHTPSSIEQAPPLETLSLKERLEALIVRENDLIIHIAELQESDPASPHLDTLTDQLLQATEEKNNLQSTITSMHENYTVKPYDDNPEANKLAKRGL